jgi:hypothetical protein
MQESNSYKSTKWLGLVRDWRLIVPVKESGNSRRRAAHAGLKIN